MANETKILVIEDNVITLGDLEIRIGKMGYENIRTAVSGEEAVEIAEDFRPDIILSDINLGEGINGIEAVRQIQEKQNVPVIYLTAYDNDRTLKEANITEPYAYLIKPLNERELKIALTIALYKYQAEKQLRELNATKDTLLSIISHDLRSPFNAILGYLKLLITREDKFDKEERKKMLSNVLKASEGTYELLENLLTWSRSQTGKLQPEQQDVALCERAAELTRVYDEIAASKGVKVINRISETLKIYADSNMLDIILRNLLSNAVKFTKSGGDVTLSAEKRDSEIVVSIKDTGIGIKPDKLPEIFDIQKDKSTPGTKEEKGSGLGLVLCKEFVQKMGGKIWVDSESGKGSEFSFSLPAGKL